jgi:hypothetical protein
MAFDDTYGLEAFLREAYAEGAPGRCERCYQMRLSHTARQARRLGMDAFTTSLLISPHQSHERIHAAGQAAADQAGVEFLYVDLRPDFEASRQEAKRLELYSQSYCGCIFSEYERYKDTTRHVYRGD